MPGPEGLRLVLIGPGRAGGSLAIAATEAGHVVVGVLSRNGNHDYGPPLRRDDPLPEADIALIAVRDDAIPEVVDGLVGRLGNVAVAAHLSGFTPVSALRPLQSAGVAIGGMHPLQTLPDPERGARALSGAYAGIGGDPLAVDVLTHLAASLGMRPFSLDDASRPAYHAAAAAASNFVTTALAVASDLYSSAGIDPVVARPLVERVVANVFEGGAASALTGPIARGDVDTVIGHLTAAHDVSAEVGRQFGLLAEATTLRAGREEDLRRWR
ncbi:MAG: DUF2520 domain-containing protein [Actinobacteria bacterium]|nr:DUF2520 domain-containing protein [Actinomycetota bacterium]MCI0543466.1 DUF2520 domain-containing protein [Actinomycetota bacterium]